MLGPVTKMFKFVWLCYSWLSSVLHCKCRPTPERRVLTTSVTDTVSSRVTLNTTPLALLTVSVLFNAWYTHPCVYIDDAISGLGFQALFSGVPAILF
jgi:hypothetical protein